MNQIVFVDTSAWLALINKSDVFHVKAKNIRDILLYAYSGDTILNCLWQ